MGLLDGLGQDQHGDRFLDAVAVEGHAAGLRLEDLLHFGHGGHHARKLGRVGRRAHEVVGIGAQLLGNDRVLVAAAVVEGHLRQPVHLLHCLDHQGVVRTQHGPEEGVGVLGLQRLHLAVEVGGSGVEGHVGHDLEAAGGRRFQRLLGGVLAEHGILVDDAEGLDVGVLLGLVEPLQDVDELLRFDLIRRCRAEEVLHFLALGQGRGARGAAHENLLGALGHEAGRHAHRAVVGADEGPHAFLVDQPLGLGLAHVGLALAVGVHEHDLVSAEDPRLVRKGHLDVGVLVVDDLDRRLHGRLAALACERHGAGQGEDGADLDDLFLRLGQGLPRGDTQHQGDGHGGHDPESHGELYHREPPLSVGLITRPVIKR